LVDDLPIRDCINSMNRIAIYCRQTGPDTDVLFDLRQAVEARGDMVTPTFADDGRMTGRGKYAGWNALVATLDHSDQVVVADAGDLPGRTVNDLLRLLPTFRDHGVGLFVNDLRIDTSSAGFAMLHLIEGYRSAKLSAAIRAGQARALAAGKHIGRPVIPSRVLSLVRACLASGDGVRPTARKFGVSPASVVTIRRAMGVGQ
jgi:DNA invertase Pin-like site-specific DNA recombinase